MKLLPSQNRFRPSLVAMTTMTLTTIFVLLCLSANEQNGVEGAKILSISFVSTKSHKIVYEPLLLKLAERGHQLTVVSPIKSDKVVPNIKEIHTVDLEELKNRKGGSFPNMFEMAGSKSLLVSIIGILGPFAMMGGFAGEICTETYALPQVQQLLNEEFDLILFPPFINDCVYGLIHKMQTPTVLISQTALMPWVASTFGIPSPPSFVPLALYVYSDKMNFFERIQNFLGSLINHVVKSWVYNPKMEKIYREFLHDPNLPSIKEIEANTSLSLVNSHISFGKPRPLMPDVIEVGGMSLRKAKPLPKDLDDFLTGSGPEGFIFFSMGSALKSSELPPKYRDIFLNTFAKLKQRVIWKWEKEEMEGLPKNVKLSKWLPQLDVLGHKNIRMFITHGGHGGTTEALYNGVPLVAIPIAGDQPYNAKRAELLGFAIQLDFAELTEEILTNAINKILNEPQYQASAKLRQSIVHDQIDNPLDRAVFWTEYVIRHKGAPHLRSAARDLTTIQYYSLDVLATLGVIAVLLTYVNYLILRTIWRKLCGGKGGKKAADIVQRKKKQ